MRGARCTPFLLVIPAMLASACGAGSSQATPPSLQTSLRALASGAPAGNRAYWLGPEFDGTPVRFADAAWGRYALLTYSRLDRVVIDVETYRAHGAGSGKGFDVRVHTRTGQDVVLVFHRPARPGAALIRAARAALEPIPARVAYPG